MIKIKTALISVTDKTGIVEFAQFLAENGVKLISTGGTRQKISDAGIPVVDISEVTGFPEIMDGRVKTLHPKVHGGLLAVRDNPEHVQAMQLHEIKEIDMVIVNLYEFEKTVASGAEFDEIIENIDIGGPSMIRSAAKNHKFVAVVTDPVDYEWLTKELKNADMHVSQDHLKLLAQKAFSRTAAYDSAISNWIQGRKFPDQINITGKIRQDLRYGENPHQEAAFYVTDVKAPGIANAEQLQGKELSYNNINDTDAAFLLVSEFAEPAAVIVKHANPCGVAIGKDLHEAYTKALAADPVSAFGGIIALNREIDSATAEEIAKLFAEVIIAPAISAKAKEILGAKKNLRVLITNQQAEISKQFSVKSVSGGLLLQDIDNANISEKDVKVVSKRAPTAEEMKDLLFAFKVVKHVKSNAIVTAKNLTSSGIGAGQMNRVGSVGIACSGDVKGHVLASDAFFPFADGVEAAVKAGITAIIHPGGSVRDPEVFAAADAAGIAMVVTGVRVFKH
jgi:phosphoribosylaminoimidazolecarboxamide formyltransferase/IMP cyclohydrolase